MINKRIAIRFCSFFTRTLIPPSLHPFPKKSIQNTTRFAPVPAFIEKPAITPWETLYIPTAVKSNRTVNTFPSFSVYRQRLLAVRSPFRRLIQPVSDEQLRQPVFYIKFSS
jgi:hypothetical protein